MKRSITQPAPLQQVYDPDAAALILIVAGILGEVPGAAAIQGWFRDQRHSASDAQRTKTILNSMLDELDHLAVNFGAIKEIATDANLPKNSPFRLGQRLWMDKPQYKRYVENTQEIFTRGARLDKAAHQLVALTAGGDPNGDPYGPEFDRHQASEVYSILNRLVHTADLSIGDAFDAIDFALKQSRALILALREPYR